MSQTPLFEVIAAEIVAMVGERGPTVGGTDAAKAAAVAVHLRDIWNARGAADIAKLEVEIPNVWTTADPAGGLTRALRNDSFCSAHSDRREPAVPREPHFPNESRLTQ